MPCNDVKLRLGSDGTDAALLRDEAAGRWRPPPPSGLLPLCSNGGLGVSPPSTQAAVSFCTLHAKRGFQSSSRSVIDDYSAGYRRRLLAVSFNGRGSVGEV